MHTGSCVWPHSLHLATRWKLLTTLPPADGGREVVAEAARVTGLATPSALGVPSSGPVFNPVSSFLSNLTLEENQWLPQVWQALLRNGFPPPRTQVCI